MIGVVLISRERERQEECYSAAHDALHDRAELAEAALAYINEAIACQGNWVNWPRHPKGQPLPNAWPWSANDWKPSDDPIRNLVKAGALVAAEIDRLLAQQEDTPDAE